MDEPQVKKLNLVVSKDRIDDFVEVDDLVGAEEGSFRAMRKLLATFLVNEDGEYVPVEEAEKVIGKLTVGQMKKKTKELFTKINDNAVPKENGTPSD